MNSNQSFFNEINQDTQKYLRKKESEYQITLRNGFLAENDMNWFMRAILVDWMFQVSMEFTFKKETCHMAIYYLDQYLNTSQNIHKNNLQLIGATALLITSKIEEVIPIQLKDIKKVCDDGYSIEEFMRTEQMILQKLQYKLKPLTLNQISNYFLLQWDLFIDNFDSESNLFPFLDTKEQIQIFFRRPNPNSYKNFQEFNQLLDLSLYYIETREYKPRTIFASFLYLYLALQYNIYCKNDIVEKIPQTSMFLFNDPLKFNLFFQKYLAINFEFNLIDLLPTIQYSAIYFDLTLNYNLPIALQVNQENILEGHYENFLAYSTYHPLGLDFIKQKFVI